MAVEVPVEVVREMAADARLMEHRWLPGKILACL